MKKRILAVLTAGLFVLTLAGCVEEAPQNSCGPVPPAVSSKNVSSEQASSEEVSSEPISSQVVSSEVSSKPVSSKAPSSKTTSSKAVSSKEGGINPNTPVSPPKDPRPQEEIDKEWAQWSAEQEENERLLKLPATFTSEIEKEVYPIGTESVIIKVKNEGPGAIRYDVYTSICKWVNEEWVTQPSLPPATVAIFGYIKGGESYDLEYSFNGYNITEAGRYRISQLIGGATQSGEYFYEFTLE